VPQLGQTADHLIGPAAQVGVHHAPQKQGSGREKRSGDTLGAGGLFSKSSIPGSGFGKQFRIGRERVGQKPSERKGGRRIPEIRRPFLVTCYASTACVHHFSRVARRVAPIAADRPIVPGLTGGVPGSLGNVSKKLVRPSVCFYVPETR